MNYFLPIMQTLSEYKTLKSKLTSTNTPTAVIGCLHIHKVHLIATTLHDFGKKGLLITADDGEALRLIDDFAAFGVDAVFYPLRDFAFRSVDSSSHEYEQQRLSALCKIIDNKYDIIVCSIDAAMQYTMPTDKLKQTSFSLKPKQSITSNEMAKRLVSAGYIKYSQVEGKGQFSVRGGIVDIFPPDALNPIRIEFWGDEIDNISSFDIETQRRIDTVKQCIITPAREVLCDTDELVSHLEKFAESLTKKTALAVKQNIYMDIDKLKNGLHLGTYDKYLPLIYDPTTIFDYLNDYMLFCSESNKIKDRAKNYLWQYAEDLQTYFEEGLLTTGLDNFTMDYDNITKLYEDNNVIYLDQFGRANYDTKVGFIINLNLRQLSHWSGAMDVLVEDLQVSLQNKMACVVIVGTDKAAQLLANDLYDAKLPAIYAKNPSEFRKSQITVIQGTISSGFEYESNGYIVITQGRGGAMLKKRKRALQKGGHIASLEEVKRGDYVVHASHGIGIFDGIEAKQIDNITKDYIKIKYQKEDTLFVPVTQLDLITKYIGSKEDGTIKLHRLGGVEWQKARSKVRAAVKEMAAQLIKLYSQRMKLKGFAFAEDNDMQNDFERRFEFDETEDQLRCVDEIKNDMQNTTPMDRLLCGDVGFGKTEVALRGAFKAILDGKQVAILVPTTILAWQHFQTIAKRFEGMPIESELLSRFRTPKQQEEILRRLKKGEIDLVVGTHRLVSQDVQFRDLGLVIIDEEQRFGVAQKERLKEVFPSVDVLTLSATPIPRTLNMAMSGLRDMSVIEEAPHDRHPVQTYVLEHDNGVIIDAIKKELRRGGQVFYLINRIDKVERVAFNIQAQIDDCNVAFAHGRMAENELSSIWKGLVEGEIDVLVCTTIIETGVDVPNCNTIIIEDSDKMGLSQLHQLRGRVGRSARRAYAYLTFKRGKVLTDIATKRLEAIREYTEFGAGFKIAMRDLEIRGSGNILGGEQHGHMDAIGYDLYLRMLSDAIKEEKGETPVSDVECLVDLPIEAHIPNQYIESVPQRLQIYRRIADIRSEEDSFDVFDELIDRFGEPPESVKGLVDIALLRNRAAAKSVYEITYKNGQVLLFLRHLNMEQVSGLINAMRGRLMVGAGNKPYLAVRILPKQSPVDALKETMDIWV